MFATIQLQYLCDRLLSLAMDNKTICWDQIMKGFKSFTNDYCKAVNLLNEIEIYKAGLEGKIPRKWILEYGLIIRELDHDAI